MPFRPNIPSFYAVRQPQLRCPHVPFLLLATIDQLLQSLIASLPYLSKQHSWVGIFNLTHPPGERYAPPLSRLLLSSAAILSLVSMAHESCQASRQPGPSIHSHVQSRSAPRHSSCNNQTSYRLTKDSLGCTFSLSASRASDYSMHVHTQVVPQSILSPLSVLRRG
jgi:hypothetical protein